MLLSQFLLDELSAEARVSPRLRMNRDMRTTVDDNSQRMLNSLEPGTQLPIHRHTETTEVVVVVRGMIEQRFYDDNGNLTGSWIVEAGGENVGVVVPKGQWHNTVSLKEGTVIFEAKDGAYAPLSPDDVLTIIG